MVPSCLYATENPLYIIYNGFNNANLSSMVCNCCLFCCIICWRFFVNEAVRLSSSCFAFDIFFLGCVCISLCLFCFFYFCFCCKIVFFLYRHSFCMCYIS